MINIEKTSRKKPEKIRELVRDIFGPRGLNLTVEQDLGGSFLYRDEQSGFVKISVRDDVSSRRSKVEAQTNEYDFQVKRLMGRL